MQRSHRRIAPAFLTVIALAVSMVSALPPALAQTPAGVPRLADLSLFADGVSMYPGFDAAITRYGVTLPSGATSLGIRAVPAGSADEVLVDGLPAPDGAVVDVQSPQPGDIIPVDVITASVVGTYELVVLAPNFPEIRAESARPEAIAPGELYMDLRTADRDWLAIVDNNGVPRWFTESSGQASDFRRQPNGLRSHTDRQGVTTGCGRNNSVDYVLLDGQVPRSIDPWSVADDLHEGGRAAVSAPLDFTDPHDFLMLPDGRRALLSYDCEDHDELQFLDSVLQVQNAAGAEVFQWRSYGVIPFSHVQRTINTSPWTVGGVAGVDWNYHAPGGATRGALEFLAGGSGVGTSRARSITGAASVELRAQISLATWRPATEQTLLGSDGAKLTLSVMPTGHLRAKVTQTSGAAVELLSTAPIVANDGDELWVRVRYDLAKGTANFGTAAPTSSDPTEAVWTPLGTDLVSLPTGTVGAVATVVAGAADPAGAKRMVGHLGAALWFTNRMAGNNLDVTTIQMRDREIEDGSAWYTRDLLEYAHVNSVSPTADGNWLLSLRGTSQVVKVDAVTGEIMWRLGGLSSDFVIDDPWGGPCGQHTAAETAAGTIVLFDNGVNCPNLPEYIGRGDIARASEYSIDEVAGRAELVWSHQQSLTAFATGSTQRFDNGNTLIGWGRSGTPRVLATEVGADGLTTLELTATADGVGIGAYRVTRWPADAPEVRVESMTVTEGDNSDVVAPVLVRLSREAVGDVRVRLRTVNGTAQVGPDVVGIDTYVTIPAGARGKVVNVTVRSDRVEEPDEELSLVLTEAIGATIAPGISVLRIADEDTTVVSSRHAGANRVATAAAISAANFVSSKTVVIGRADSYADALAAAPLAGLHDAPILLTGRDALASSTRDEIARLGATKAILSGGAAAISDAVADELAGMGLSVRRVSGPDRFATAAAAAREVHAGITDRRVFLTQGVDADPSRGWADAVAVSALAAQLRQPILLTRSGSLPDATRAALVDGAVKHVTIVGGTVSVSETVAEEIRGLGIVVERVSGADRYATALAVADRALAAGFGAGSKSRPPAATLTVWLATGANWPDSVGAGAAIAHAGGVLVLINGSAGLDRSGPLATWLDANHDSIAEVRVVGGQAAVTDPVVAGLVARLR